MSRYKDSFDLPIDEVFPPEPGKCSFCKKTLTGRQTKWCSKKCSYAAFDETMFRRGSSKHIRDKVFERDDGICAECGVDCKPMHRISEAASSKYETASNKRMLKEYFTDARALFKDTFRRKIKNTSQQNLF